MRDPSLAETIIFLNFMDEKELNNLAKYLNIHLGGCDNRKDLIYKIAAMYVYTYLPIIKSLSIYQNYQNRCLINEKSHLNQEFINLSRIPPPYVIRGIDKLLIKISDKFILIIIERIGKVYQT